MRIFQCLSSNKLFNVLGFTLKDFFLVEQYKKNLTRTNRTDQCSFNVTTLYCVNKGLTEFPPNPPVQLLTIEIRKNPQLKKLPDGIYVTQKKMTEQV